MAAQGRARDRACTAGKKKAFRNKSEASRTGGMPRFFSLIKFFFAKTRAPQNSKRMIGCQTLAVLNNARFRDFEMSVFFSRNADGS